MVEMAEPPLDRLQAWLLSHAAGTEGRIPPERRLAAELGLSRTELRKALAALEAQGRLTRHVGRGTFLHPASAAGARPPPSVRAEPEPHSSGEWVASVAAAAMPREIMQARLVIEPELAKLAAVNGSAHGVAAIRRAEAEVAAASSWAAYDGADRAFHRAIAGAAANGALAALFDLLMEVGDRVAWAPRADRGPGPAPDHSSLAEHRALAEAIARRDEAAAGDALRHHLLVETASIVPRLI